MPIDSATRDGTAQPSVAGSAPGRATPPGELDALAATLVSLVPTLRALSALLIATIIIGALYFGRSLLIPFALAMLLGFLLDPLVRRLHRWRLPRTLAVLLVVGLALGVVGGIGAYVTTQLTALSADLPTYQHTIRTKLHALRTAIYEPGAWSGAMKTLETVQKEIDTEANGRRAPAPTRVEIVGPESRPVHVALNWLDKVSEPVVTVGIALLFLVFVLMDWRFIRERLLRLSGTDLHVATDAMDEASARIGRYLRVQFTVNLCYGVPMGLGLWWIGVPSAALWGFVAALMRFVPYVGSIVSAVFPLALAFAVSRDWSMVLWTLALIASLELIFANAIEPWLYGSTTGLSPMSIIVAAIFWTALWGPIGLILSTPLTVCLVVAGRYLPSLRFIEVLLGSESTLAPSQRLYQRLLAGDGEDAADFARGYVVQRRSARPGDDMAAALVDFYADVGVPTLCLATRQQIHAAGAGHRLRFATGMEGLLAELHSQYPAPGTPTGPLVYCLGARTNIDVAAAEMITHALAWQGYRTWRARYAILPSRELDLPHAATRPVTACISVFGTQPQARIRLIARRLRRSLPRVRIVAAAWDVGSEMPEESDLRHLGVDAIAGNFRELILQVDHLAPVDGGLAGAKDAPLPADDAARVAALHASGALDQACVPLHEAAIRQALNAFDVQFAEISWIDAEQVHTPVGSLSREARVVPREGAPCSHVLAENAQALVVNDIRRDPRFAEDPLLAERDVRFYAAVPIRDNDGHVLGALCIMDGTPRDVNPQEQAVLTEMADRLMQAISTRGANGHAQAGKAGQ